MQALLVFWEPIPCVGVLKVEVLNVGSKAFTPQGKAGTGHSLPIVWCCAGVEFMVKVCLSLTYVF